MKIVELYQRSQKGYSNADLQDFDVYFATLISKAIRQIQKEGKGYPATVTEPQWKGILEEVAVGFECVPKLNGLLKNQVQEERMKEKFNRGMKLFHKYFFFFWE